MEKTCSRCGRCLPSTPEYFHRQVTGRHGLRSICKECRGMKFGAAQPNKVYKAKDGHKYCACCGRELPADVLHFYRHGEDYVSKCKECSGAKFGVRMLNTVYPVVDGSKYCTVCRKIKPLSAFSKLKESRDGHMSRCKECDRKVCIISSGKPEAKNKKGQYSKEYRKRYYSTKHGKNINAINCHKRKARKRETVIDYSTQIWEKCVKCFKDRCAYCGKSGGSLTQEHFIPLSRGGEYTEKNIIPACSWCNGSKKDRDFYEWYPQQKFYSPQRELEILDYLEIGG